MRSAVLGASCAIVLFLTGCPEAEPSGDEEACEHLAEGPATAVTAVASGVGPLIDDDHRRYDVALVAVDGGNGGEVRFASAEAGDYVFFLDADVSLAVTDVDGSPVALEASETASATCPETIRARHHVELGVGTYSLRFGPTEQSSVGVVVEAHAHEHAHAE
jgi:hypothetical protein